MAKKVKVNCFQVKTKSGIRTFATLGGACAYAKGVEFDEFISITKKNLFLNQKEFNFFQWMKNYS